MRDSCLADVDACDLYVLIVGYRYGFQPPGDNPERLSITQLEFRRAGQKGKPRVALLRTSSAHLAGADDAASFDLKSGDDFNVVPTGNAVSLEDEMMKVAANQMDFQAATALYARGLGLIRTAIGK